MRIAHRSRNRSGVTLLEVIVSSAIFGGSMVAILHLMNIGSNRALDVQHQAKASLFCQSKLAEVAVGIEPLTGGGDYQPMGEEANWTWKMEAQQADVDGLWNVKVWVKRETSEMPTLETFISQMILDPSRRGSTLDPVVTPATTGTTTGTDAAASDSTSTSGTTTGGTAK